MFQNSETGTLQKCVTRVDLEKSCRLLNEDLLAKIGFNKSRAGSPKLYYHVFSFPDYAIQISSNKLEKGGL